MYKVWWRELWAFREVLAFLVWRDITVRYKQTLLGVAWAVLQPLATMMIFTIFFGNLAKVPSDGIPYAVFTYSALTAWTFFTTAVVSASNSLITNQNLVSKVYVPRIMIPGAAILSFVPDFIVSSLILLVLMLFYGVPLSWTFLWWPVLLVPVILLAFAFGLILSALNVRYRDIKYVVPFAMQLLLFATPVIYPISLVPEKYRALMALNPLTGLIDAFRATALHGRSIDWFLFGAGCGLTLLAVTIGMIYFRNAEQTFADTI